MPPARPQMRKEGLGRTLHSAPSTAHPTPGGCLLCSGFQKSPVNPRGLWTCTEAQGGDCWARTGGSWPRWFSGPPGELGIEAAF